MDTAIELQDIHKSFGSVPAIQELTLSVPRGATYGLIGPSGAGKTTVIRMIMSILLPDSGRLSVLGQSSALAVKDRIGYLPEERGVYRKMRVGSYLSYVGCLKGGARDRIEVRARALLRRLGVEGAVNKRCEDLSRGMLQRVQFVAAMTHEPELLILDEPFSGLDPVSVEVLKEVVAEEQRRGITTIFSTHVMAHAEELCQQIIMIHEGRKVLDAPMAGLRRQFDHGRIRFEPLDAGADLLALGSVAGVTGIRLMGQGCEIELASGFDPADVMRAVVARIAPARIELARVRLEDVFISLVGNLPAPQPSAGALSAHLGGLTTVEGAR